MAKRGELDRAERGCRRPAHQDEFAAERLSRSAGWGGMRRSFQGTQDPYYIGDNVALTQTAGWVDAWESQPSVYAVAAETTGDVVAAVNFVRDNNLRLVVKGGGHSYLGRSNAPDSLMIWTRHMNAISLHDDFIPQGSRHSTRPNPPSRSVRARSGCTPTTR